MFANYSLGLLQYLKLLVQIDEPIMKSKPLVALAGASCAVGAVHAFFAIFARTSRSPTKRHFSGVVEYAVSL